MTEEANLMDISKLFDIEQEYIRKKYRYNYFLTAAAPNSGTLWPNDLRPHDYDELRTRLSGLIQSPAPTPYVDYDTWLNANCGPNGYARVGSTVGFRDRAAAEAFLRWIVPILDDRGTSANHDLKLHLARMMVKAVPNEEITDDIIITIGDDIVHGLEPAALASLCDRIHQRDKQKDRNEILAIESEQLAVKVMRLFRPVEQGVQAD